LTEGNLVNAGGSDPLLTTIVSVNPIRIYFNVDERSLQRYAKGIGARGGGLVDMLANLKEQKAKFSFALRFEQLLDPHRILGRLLDDKIHCALSLFIIHWLL